MTRELSLKVRITDTPKTYQNRFLTFNLIGNGGDLRYSTSRLPQFSLHFLNHSLKRISRQCGLHNEAGTRQPFRDPTEQSIS